MTSKSRKRTTSRREVGDVSLTGEPSRREPEVPASIATAQIPKAKPSLSPTSSPKLLPQQQEDEDSDEDGPMKAHLGKNKRPDLIGTRPCERFLNGHCNFGKDCWFVHDVEAREATRAQGSLSGSAPSMSLADEPPKPKISLAPTNPWGRKTEENDEYGEDLGPLGENVTDSDMGHHLEEVNGLVYQMGADSGEGVVGVADKLEKFQLSAAANSNNLPHGASKAHHQSSVDSSLPPATASTQPALGVFSVVDMLASVRSSLFQDAISRGLRVSVATHDSSSRGPTL